MVNTGGQNLDIIITSTFNAAGFQQATKVLNQFVNLCNKFNGNVQKIAQQMDKLSQETAKMSQGYGAYLNKLKQVNEYMNGSMSKGYGSFLSNINQVQSSLRKASSETEGFANTMGSVMGRVSNRIGSAVSGIKGYFNGLINTTISVGDVFGYYLGSMAVDAVYKLATELAVIQDNAVGVFKFIGMSVSEVDGLVQGLTASAAKMAQVSAGEMLNVFEKIRLSVKMSSSDMLKYNGVVGDMITLFKENGRSANDAALAIEDVISGGSNAARRLQEIGLTTGQLKKYGYSITEDAGNYTKFFDAMTKAFEERDVAGIAYKINSIGDAVNFLGEQCQIAGSKVGAYFIPYVRDFAIWFGKIVTITPAPIIGLVMAFVGLLGSIMVLMPFIASLVVSFSTLGQVFDPLTRRYERLTRSFKGWDKVTSSSSFGTHIAEQFKIADKEAKKLEQDRPKTIDVGGQQVKRVKTTGGDTEYYVKQGSGLDLYTKKVNNASKSVDRFNKNTKSLHGTAGKGPGLFSRMSTSIGNFGTKVKGGVPKVKAFGTSLKGLGSSIGSLLLTNPVGWIIDIISVLMIVLTYSNSWGKVMAWLDGVLKSVGAAVDWCVEALTKWYEQEKKTVTSWSGWTKFKGILEDIYNGLVGIVVTCQEVAAAVFEAEGSWDGWAQMGDAFIYVYTAVKKTYDILILGKGSWTDTKERVVGLTGAMILLSNPIGILIVTLGYLKAVISGVREQFKKWADSEEGKQTLEQLAFAANQLQTAWTELKDALQESWNQLKPSIDDLCKALGDLWIALGGTPTGQNTKDTLNGAAGAAGQAQTPLSLVSSIVWGLVKIIQISIPIIKAIAWVLTNVVIPAIKISLPVLKFLLDIFTGTVKALRTMYQAYQQAKTVMAPFAAALMTIWNPAYTIYTVLKKIVCIIIGCSPGIIPAIQLLLVTAQGLFPRIASIIRSAMGSALSVVVKFVVDTVSKFKQLPGKVFQALGSLKTLVMQAVQNAYSGAMSKAEKFYELGKKIKDRVVKGIMDALGIHSPSTVTYALGEYISQGLINGMTTWVNNNTGKFAQNLKDKVGGSIAFLNSAFSNFAYKFYFDSLQTVNTTLTTMTGNCMDAALAFQALASKVGITSQMYRTFVNGIPHRVINLPTLNAWIDPSGILGKGIHQGQAPGSPAGGAQTTVYVNNPVVREEQDINKIGLETSRRTYRAVRYGI